MFPSSSDCRRFKIEVAIASDGGIGSKVGNITNCACHIAIQYSQTEFTRHAFCLRKSLARFRFTLLLIEDGQRESIAASIAMPAAA
jgi:hypothetical protein